MRGVKTDGPMAPEISLERQRPAEFVFSRHVEKMLSDIPRKARGVGAASSSKSPTSVN
jgi:hypothetical protein